MNESYVKNLGQVAAIVFSSTPPELTKILWYDLGTDLIKIYNKKTGSWGPLVNSLVGAENLAGQGTGFIFKETSDSLLKFRRLKGGTGVKVTTESNDILLELSSFLQGNPDVLEFDSSVGVEKSFFITSNISWRVLGVASIPWITFSTTQGYGYSEVTLTTSSVNSATTSRSGTFFLNDPSGEFPDKQVTVTQVGSQTFSGMYVQQVVDFVCEQ